MEPKQLLATYFFPHTSVPGRVHVHPQDIHVFGPTPEVSVPRFFLPILQQYASNRDRTTYFLAFAYGESFRGSREAFKVLDLYVMKVPASWNNQHTRESIISKIPISSPHRFSPSRGAIDEDITRILTREQLHIHTSGDLLSYVLTPTKLGPNTPHTLIFPEPNQGRNILEFGSYTPLGHKRKRIMRQQSAKRR